MKLFIAENLEQYGCPIEVFILGDSLDECKKRLIEEFPEIEDTMDQIIWRTEDDLFVVYLG